MRRIPETHKIVEITTPEGRTERVYADRPKNLSEMMDNAVKKYGEREGMIDQDSRLTYRQFVVLVDKVASMLYHRYGVRKGDRVALMLRNGLDFAVSLFAMARIGAITVPLNTGLKSEEITYQLKDSGSAMLVVESDFYGVIAEAVAKAGGVKNIFVTGRETPADTSPFSELTRDTDLPLVSEKVDETDSIAIIYTSGTTGHPKGALLSYKGVIACAMNAAFLTDLQSGRDKMMAVVPLFHVTGISMLLCAAVYAGVPLVLVKRFKAVDTLKTVEAEKATVMIAVPTIFWLMLNSLEFNQYDLSSLRFFAAGGSATPADLLKCCAEKLPHVQLVPGYGLTEGCAVTHSTISFEEAVGRLGTVGLPVPTLDAKVVGSDEKEMPPGVPGELLIKGCQVMQGYWNNPEATRETIVNGWLHTGDVAIIKEDGYTYIFDRIKDMIIRGGENIYCIEIENVLYRHPKVLEAAVLGVPDPVFGEQVKAVLVLRPDMQATVEEIQEFCQQYLAYYKVPKFVEFRETMPRNPGGKVIKGELK